MKFEDAGVPFEERQERPMRILIINDDGYENEGINILYDELESRGYDVWVVAPYNNMSGIGTAIFYGVKYDREFVQISDKKFAFEGTPTDAFKVAIDLLMKENQPDLVISGVNDGPNVGESQINSGTVSGAVRAARHGYPSIAASISIPENLPLETYIQPASEFVANMVDEFNEEWKNGEMMLPKGTSVSINYPTVPSDKILGIKYIDNDEYYESFQTYAYNEGGIIAEYMDMSKFYAILGNPDIESDMTELFKGYITISTLEPNWNAPAEKTNFVKELLEGIEIPYSNFD